MNCAARLCLLGSLEAKLRLYLTSHPEGHERAAVVLFRRFSHAAPGLAPSDRYVAVEVIPLEEASITASSRTTVDFQLAPLRDLFRRCEEEQLVFGFAHNHPSGPKDFSGRDDQNELTLLRAISNRNGQQVTMVALLWSEGTWLGRTRSAASPLQAIAVRHTVVVSEFHVALHGVAGDKPDDEGVSSRQAAAFGQPFVDQLRALRIGVVGASGTGSPTCTLLARSGVGELVVIDPDVLSTSNLNRARGARRRDVGRNKAQWLTEYLRKMDLGTNLAAFTQDVDLDSDAVDTLATCDLIFGCTDDQIGRHLLNAVCFRLGIPLIDMGLGGWIAQDSSDQIRLRGHYGRISVVCPEAGDCLECQQVVTSDGVRRQYALRENPNLSEAELQERYITGGGQTAPGVGPFTSAVGDYAVAALYDLLTRFRRWPTHLRRDHLLIDFVMMELRSSESRARPDCPYCGTRELLLKPSRYRLGLPALGIAPIKV